MIKKINNKILIMLLIFSFAIMQTNIVFALSEPSLKIYQHNAVSDKIILDVSLDKLPQNTTSLQLEIKLSKKIDTTDKEISWVYKNDNAYTTYKVLDIDENYKKLIIYVANNTENILSEKVNLITIAVSSANKDLIAGMTATSLKILDDNLKDTMYKDIPTVVTTEESNKPGGGDLDDDKNDKDKDKVEEPTKPTSPSFTDIDSHWANSSILRMVQKGIIEGYKDGTFRPDNDVTRAEFSVLINRVFDLKSGISSLPFVDVDPSEWYSNAILNLYSNNIIMGKSSDKFGTKDNITNEQIAVMLVRALNSQNSALEKVRLYTGFDDEDTIQSYAKDAVIYLYEAGIINGSYNNFNPQSNSTRAQVATMLDRIITLIEK